MSAENLSVVLKSKGDLRLEDRPVPEPAPNEVLIAIHSVGICGSDVHYWTHGAIGDFVVKAPMVLGHESSGTIVKVGSKVENLKPGDRVAIEPGVPCRICEFCKCGRYNLCPNVKFCATPPDDGTLCRYFTHAADFCYKLPDHVSFDEGALLEPLSVAVQACRRAGVTAGSYVLICGAGPIGLMNLLTTKAMAASQIFVTDICDNRLKMAKSLGAHHTINVSGKDVETIIQEIRKEMGNFPNISIECSGAPSSMKLAILATRSGGTVVQVGHGPAEVTLPIVNATVREVDIRGIFRYANCYPISLGLVASGAVNVKPLITHHYPMENALDAFETSRVGRDNAIKVIIRCNK